MLNRSTMLAIAAAALLPSAAGATSFTQYSFSGTVAGTRTLQPMGGPGATENVAGRVTFTYFLPATSPTPYFLGGSSSFSAGAGTAGFTETGWNGVGGRGELAATACFGTGGAVDAGCGFARIVNGWRNGSYDLTGTIDSFVKTELATAPSEFKTIYDLNLTAVPKLASSLTVLAGTSSIAAVPEPTSWAMMVAGFALLGGAIRRRPRRGLAVA